LFKIRKKSLLAFEFIFFPKSLTFVSGKLKLLFFGFKGTKLVLKETAILSFVLSTLYLEASSTKTSKFTFEDTSLYFHNTFNK